MSSFFLKGIKHEHLHVLDRMLQLYVHDINTYFDYPVVLDNNGRYRIKQVGEFLSDGFGYFIFVNCEYAGFVLLNNKTKPSGGVFVSEFYILPGFRKGLFYEKLLFSLFSELKGRVEFRILNKNMRALVLFKYLVKKYVSKVVITDECENEEKYFFAKYSNKTRARLFFFKMRNSTCPFSSENRLKITFL